MPNEWNPPAQAGYKTGGKWLARRVPRLPPSWPRIHHDSVRKGPTWSKRA